jgi:hypothetical protein
MDAGGAPGETDARSSGQRQDSQGSVRTDARTGA